MTICGEIMRVRSKLSVNVLERDPDDLQERGGELTSLYTSSFALPDKPVSLYCSTLYPQSTEG